LPDAAGRAQHRHIGNVLIHRRMRGLLRMMAPVLGVSRVLAAAARRHNEHNRARRRPNCLPLLRLGASAVHSRGKAPWATTGKGNRPSGHPRWAPLRCIFEIYAIPWTRGCPLRPFTLVHVHPARLAGAELTTTTTESVPGSILPGRLALSYAS
jgi:hypothetical protein